MWGMMCWHKRIVVPVLFASLSFFAVIAMPYSSWATNKEHLVKAAFLYNFTKFVEWPHGKNEVTICVAGSKDAYNAARQIEKRSTEQMLYRVVYDTQDPQRCSLYYSYQDGAEPVVLSPNGENNPPVLLVGMGEAFIEKGGMIAFILVEGKIKLVINPAAVKRAGLEIDSQLLEIAYKVVQE
jgi:hypothetical protein